jgi:hypothetical protein
VLRFVAMGEPESSGADLLAVTLLVFFVTLILTVSALLVLPVIL